MKRNDAGYALPLVLVVLTVLCLLAMAVMGFSLDSYQSQQRSVAYMQAKYEAQGKLEILEAKLTKALPNPVTEDLVKSYNLAEAIENWSIVTSQEEWTFSVTVAGDLNDEEEVLISCDILLKAESGKMTLTYTRYAVDTQPKGGQDG